MIMLIFIMKSLSDKSDDKHVYVDLSKAQKGGRVDYPAQLTRAEMEEIEEQNRLSIQNIVNVNDIKKGGDIIKYGVNQKGGSGDAGSSSKCIQGNTLFMGDVL